MAKNRNIDMINGPLFSGIMTFSVPLMISNLLQMLFNAADTVVVGKFAGQIPLAAVGATNSLIFLFTSLFQGLSTGTNVIVAQRIGARDSENVKKAVHTSILMGVYGGIGLSLLAFVFSKPLLILLSTPADIIDYSILYIRIYLGGAIFIFEYNFLSGVLRAKGDTKRPMYYLMFAGVINVVLNLIFVVVFKMDVKGVALATVIAQAISASLCFLALLKDEDDTRFETEYLKFDWAMGKEIMRIGVPAGVQGMAFSFTNLIIQSSLNSFNSSVIVAGNTAAANIENFIYIGMMAFQSATVTFTSQCVGAKRKDRVLPIFFETLFLVCVSTIALGFIAWYKGELFLSFYTDEITVIEAGMFRLFYVALFLFLNGILDVFACSLRGMGKSFLPTGIMLFGIIVTRIVWVFTVFAKQGSLSSLYMCFPVSWMVTVLIYAFVYIFVCREFLRS